MFILRPLNYLFSLHQVQKKTMSVIKYFKIRNTSHEQSNITLINYSIN